MAYLDLEEHSSFKCTQKSWCFLRPNIFALWMISSLSDTFRYEDFLPKIKYAWQGYYFNHKRFLSEIQLGIFSTEKNICPIDGWDSLESFWFLFWSRTFINVITVRETVLWNEVTTQLFSLTIWQGNFFAFRDAIIAYHHFSTNPKFAKHTLLALQTWFEQYKWKSHVFFRVLHLVLYQKNSKIFLWHRNSGKIDRIFRSQYA